MTMVQLSEVARVHGGGRLKLSGKHFVEKGTPAYGAGGLNGYVDAVESSEPAVILSSIGARCGKCFITTGPWVSLANTQVILPDPSRVDARFLWYQLNDEARWPRSGSGQPFIKPSDVKTHLISLPPLPEQRRIAAILDQADAIRTKRRQVLTHLDAYVASLFDAMFTGEHHPITTLSAVSGRAGEYGANVPSVEMRAGLPRYVRITDITENGSLSDDPRGPSGSPEDWSRYTLQDGDLLFARSGATVGKAFRYRESDGPCVYAGYLIRFRPNAEMIDPDFLYAYTRTSRYRAWVTARQNVVAQPNINAKQYGNELPIPLPPIGQQRKFAERVREVSARQASVSSALAKDDELFSSLQARAFRGEL